MKLGVIQSPQQCPSQIPLRVYAHVRLVLGWNRHGACLLNAANCKDAHEQECTMPNQLAPCCHVFITIL